MRDLRSRLNKLEATYLQRGLTATAVPYENPLAGIPLTMAGRLACVFELFDLARQRKATGAEPYPIAAGDEPPLQRCVNAIEVLRSRAPVESFERKSKMQQAGKPCPSSFDRMSALASNNHAGTKT